MGKLDLDAVPDKPLRMNELLAMLDADDRTVLLDAITAQRKRVADLRNAVMDAYPELPSLELKTWNQWAANYRQGKTSG